MKRLANGWVIGFIGVTTENFVGPDGRERTRGDIGITASSDGRHFSQQQRIPMKWLTTDYDRQQANNGGLLGTPEGYILGNSTVFYFGAGYGAQTDPQPYGKWPPLDWDIAAISVRILLE
jgi:hypothetical protein